MFCFCSASSSFTHSVKLCICIEKVVSLFISIRQWLVWFCWLIFVFLVLLHTGRNIWPLHCLMPNPRWDSLSKCICGMSTIINTIKLDLFFFLNVAKLRNRWSCFLLLLKGNYCEDVISFGLWIISPFNECILPDFNLKCVICGSQSRPWILTCL